MIRIYQHICIYVNIEGNIFVVTRKEPDSSTISRQLCVDTLLLKAREKTKVWERQKGEFYK